MAGTDVDIVNMDHLSKLLKNDNILLAVPQGYSSFIFKDEGS